MLPVNTDLLNSVVWQHLLSYDMLLLLLVVVVVDPRQLVTQAS